MTMEMSVKGMTCNHCVMSVKGALKHLKGVGNVDVNLNTGKVKIDFEGDESRREEFKKAIEEQGYDVVE